ncbi:MAG TPA: hypothetical protein VFV63_02095 [Ilumatobacteraceae bacterium]|nr:hypothetical protein [Ilumatobacteraceae bacterium]
MNRSIDQDDVEIETLLRRRLNELADHAPVAVRYPDEIVVSASTADVPNRRRRAAGIGATIAVIAGGVGISTLAFQGAGNPGGADSPEEAVQAFADALEREDVLGMIDVALPEELDALRAVVEDATSEVERIGILDESFALDAVAGIDVTIPGLTLRTEHLDADLAVVTATGGSFDVSFDPASFPLGSVIREVVGDDLVASRSSEALSGTDPGVMLATVARDGRWYVSLGFTVAEYARLAAGADFPPHTAIERVGHDSPEAAALALYERLAALDLEGAIAMMAPGEGDALVRYAPLFVPDATAAIEQARAEGLTLSISGVEFETSGSGDRPTLTPVSFVVEGTVPSTLDSGLVADPTLPTIVYASDGRYAVVPAGEQVPATIDEVELVTEFPGPTLANQTYEMPDGTILPLEFATSEPEPPEPLRIERREGCTDLTGPGVASLFPQEIGAASTAGESTAIDGGYRVCGDRELFAGSVFSVLFGSLVPVQLPGISLVESDGVWYVSPIGTLGASLVDLLRSVPDDANLIDTPLAPFLFGGMSRQWIDSSLAGVNNIPPVCDAVLAFGADGVAAVVPDPPVGQIRACVEALFEFGVVNSSGTFAPAPAGDDVEFGVPASTAPAPLPTSVEAAGG